MSVKNIEKVLSLVDDVDLNEGKQAYHNYNNLLRNISSYYKVGFSQTVAAFVSLSPNNDFIGNVRSLVSLIQGIGDGRPKEDIVVSTYCHCLFRAYNYMVGNKDFLLETDGLKITNFYCNILLPDSKRYVTIDGHMHNVWRGEKATMSESALSREKYNKIAYDFKNSICKKWAYPQSIAGCFMVYLEKS
jgi:hypothetical protein